MTCLPIRMPASVLDGPLAFMTPGFMELMVVATLALLIWGGDLPDMMRTLGRAYGKLRGSMSEFSRPVREEVERVKRSTRASLSARAQQSAVPSSDTEDPTTIDAPSNDDETPTYETEAELDLEEEYTLDSSPAAPDESMRDEIAADGDTVDDDPPWV